MLKLKFVKAFFYAEATVAAPSCSPFSWICSSVHTMYAMYRLAKWRAKFNILTRIYDVINSPIYIPNCHETTLTLWLTGSL